jgi:archaemetzincin
MRSLRVVPVGAPDASLLDTAARTLGTAFRLPCSVSGPAIDPRFALHPERNQFLSTSLVERLAREQKPGEALIGVTELDLYIPILTFVFGEAQLGGGCAVVSYHRLAQEFYGLPPDRPLLHERLAKEAVHEAGHAAGLVHCDDYECVMAAAHSVEWLDLKQSGWCAVCRGAAVTG